MSKATVKKTTKHKIGIREIVMIPVLILGIFSIVSNIIGLSNVRSVNKEADQIANNYLESISSMSKIQEDVQNIHQKALSHIIATKFETMVTIVEEIDADEATLDAELKEYQQYVTADTAKQYNAIIENYLLYKDTLKNLIAYSANSETSLAYQCANNEFADYGDAIRSNIDLLNEEAHTLANEAKSNLSATYRSAFITNVFIFLYMLFMSLLSSNFPLDKYFSNFCIFTLLFLLFFVNMLFSFFMKKNIY